MFSLPLAFSTIPKACGFEAAIHFASNLLGGSLIPIVVNRDGDGFSLAKHIRNEYYFFWNLDVKKWNYFFINGKIKLFSSAADALKGTPVHLGGQCNWEISSRIQDSKSLVSAGLKDTNGCTLRIVRQTGQTVSPTLTLIKDGKVETEEKMKFG